MKRPNIVFILTDDQRFDTIAALGNSEVKTPHMDELVNSGTAFTQAHIPGGTCGAVCMPSRAMIHSGKSLFHLADNGSYIPEEHLLLGEFLRSKGYDSCGIGKWHNSPEAYARSFSSGGEIFFGGMWDHWNIPACAYDPKGTYDYKVPYTSDAFHSREVDMMITDHITPGKHSSNLFADFAADWLTRRTSDTPFFLYTAFMAPHDPRTMPKEYLELYDKDTISIPKNFAPEHLFDFGIRDVRDEVLAPYPRTEEEVRCHIAEYYGMITHLDDQIGKIITTLKKQGEYENSIIILAGDNGLALGQHGLFGKQNAYEHSVRVPLIIAGPGLKKEQICEDPCYLLDIFPTICDALELERPEGLEGKSLYAQLTGKSTEEKRDTLYFAYADLLRGIKKDGYKLIEYAQEDRRFTQLFNIEEDPQELINLAEDPAYESIMLHMRDDLIKERDQWDDMKTPVGKRFWDSF